MPIAKLEAVQPVLDAFGLRLRAVLDRAMEDWLQHPNRSELIYARTGANYIFDRIAHHALIEFDGDGADTVKALPEAQTVKFLFRNSVVARFKKGNSKGVGSNIETQAVLNFVDPQGIFAGIPEIHRVEIVYQLNVLGTGFAEVAVVARDRKTRLWSYPLDGRSADIIPLPTRTPPTLSPPAVTPKAAPDVKTGDDEKPE